MKIDFHAHCDIADPVKIREFVETYEERETIACLVGGEFYGGHDMVPNDELIKICAQYPAQLIPMAKINLLDNLDLSILALYAEAYSLYIEASKHIQAEGLTVQG